MSKSYFNKHRKHVCLPDEGYQPETMSHVPCLTGILLRFAQRTYVKQNVLFKQLHEIGLKCIIR